MTRLQDAARLYQEDRAPEAIAAFEAIIADGEPPEAAAASVLLGDLLERGGDLDGAAGAYRRAADLGDTRVASMGSFALGTLSEARGDLAQARSAYRRAIESGHKENGARAAFNLALIEHRTGNISAAIDTYRVVLDFGHPDDPVKAARNLGGLLYEAGDMAGARSAYQIVIDAGPGQHFAGGAFGLAGVLDATGDTSGALAALTLAADSDDEQIAPHAAMRLALRSERSGDTEEARCRYRQAAESHDPQLRDEAQTALESLAGRSAASAIAEDEPGTKQIGAPTSPIGERMPMPPQPQKPMRRAIRVFISSTFADMQLERDELVKHVFPKLRELCESRGVAWTEVDLRWGITDEQRDEGLVLPICLQEIRECRPYFIGLLGDRYGFVPEFDDALLEAEPWLAAHAGKSVTELEIVHGVLADPSMAENAFFYFRHPSRAAFADVARTPGDAERLATLKARIRASGLPVRENYSHPRELGRLVLEDFTGVIDRLFPRGSQPTKLERERLLHDEFRRSCTDVYVCRAGDFARLDEHADSTDPPLVLVGESGVGKSALLANWAQRLDAASEDALLGGEARRPFLITHFVAASPADADWAVMVRRIVDELSSHFELEIKPGLDAAALQASLVDALNRSAAKGQVILIIDGVDRLEDRDGASDLVWLPPLLPQQVRLVVAALPGRALDELTRRGSATFEVKPLEFGEREEMIYDYLGQYQKTLSDDLVDRIARAPQSSSPLFLRTLLEELRIYGDHSSLARRISELLSARDIPWLYGLLYDRWQRDYERDRPGLVRKVFTLLSAARSGLTEGELLDMLGMNGDPLPHALWAPLALAAKSALANRNGLLGFTNDYARSAAQLRFLSGDRVIRAAHTALAGYFAARPHIGIRELEELPWQLAAAEEWEVLEKLLVLPEIVEGLGNAAPYDLRRYWAEIEAASQLRMVDAYRPLLDDADLTPAAMVVLSELLHANGHLDEALAFSRALAERARSVGDRVALAAALDSEARALLVRGDHDTALAVAEEQEALCRELGDFEGVQRVMGTRAQMLRDGGDPVGALTLLREQELLCRQQQNDMGLQACLADQAICLRRRGELDAAVVLSQASERICRRIGHEDGAMRAVGLQGMIRSQQGELDAASKLYQRLEEHARAVGNRELVQASLQYRANIFLARRDLDRAADLYAEAEQICRDVGLRPRLAAILLNRASIQLERRDLDAAMAILEEHAAICRDTNQPDSLASAMSLKARVCEQSGNLDGAIAQCEEQEHIWRDLQRRGDLQACLAEQARLWTRQGDKNRALAKLQESERICRDLGQLRTLADNLRRHAALLTETGTIATADEIYLELVATLRQLGEPDEALETLNQLAILLRDDGDTDIALRVQDEREAILRDRGDAENCANCMIARAILRRDHGEIDTAIAELVEAERLLREIDGSETLMSALGVHAIILKDLGNTGEALALFDECATLARAGIDKQFLLIILDERLRILRANGDRLATLTAVTEREAVFRDISAEAAARARQT